MTPRLATSCLHLIDIERSAAGARLTVQVGPKGPWTLWPWGGSEVRAAVHVIGADGAMLHHDGPRSEVIPMQHVKVEPPTATIDVPADLLQDAAAIEVDLVVEGVAWGSEKGVVPLCVPLSPPS